MHVADLLLQRQRLLPQPHGPRHVSLLGDDAGHLVQRGRPPLHVADLLQQRQRLLPQPHRPRYVSLLGDDAGHLCKRGRLPLQVADLVIQRQRLLPQPDRPRHVSLLRGQAGQVVLDTGQSAECFSGGSAPRWRKERQGRLVVPARLVDLAQHHLCPRQSMQYPPVTCDAEDRQADIPRVTVAAAVVPGMCDNRRNLSGDLPLAVVQGQAHDLQRLRFGAAGAAHPPRLVQMAGGAGYRLRSCVGRRCVHHQGAQDGRDVVAGLPIPRVQAAFQEAQGDGARQVRRDEGGAGDRVQGGSVHRDLVGAGEAQEDAQVGRLLGQKDLQQDLYAELGGSPLQRRQDSAGVGGGVAQHAVQALQQARIAVGQGSRALARRLPLSRRALQGAELRQLLLQVGAAQRLQTLRVEAGRTRQREGVPAGDDHPAGRARLADGGQERHQRVARRRRERPAAVRRGFQVLLEVVEDEERRRAGQGGLQADAQARLQGKPLVVEALQRVRVLQAAVQHLHQSLRVEGADTDQAPVPGQALAQPDG